VVSGAPGFGPRLTASRTVQPFYGDADYIDALQRVAAPFLASP